MSNEKSEYERIVTDLDMYVLPTATLEDRAKHIAQLLTVTQRMSIKNPRIPKGKLPAHAIVSREYLAKMGLFIHSGAAFRYTPLGEAVYKEVVRLEEAGL